MTGRSPRRRPHSELALWAEHHGFTDAELADVQQAAVAAAFCDEATRAELAERGRSAGPPDGAQFAPPRPALIWSRIALQGSHTG